MVLFRVRVEGLENFPRAGAVVLCANHTYYKDLIVVGSISPRKIRWMAKAELFRFPVFGALIKKLGAFPINRGAHDRDSIKTVYGLLNAGETLGIFPEGTRIADPVHRPPFKRGFVTFAANTGASLLPVAVKYEGGPFGRGRLFCKITLSYGKPVRMNRDKQYARGELDGIAASANAWINARL